MILQTAVYTFLCGCSSEKPYSDCCAPIHQDLREATTAESLMRARYCAFTKGLIDFLYNSFHPTTRRFQQKAAIAQWASANKWMQLEVLRATETTVEFKAHYLNANGEVEIHHEKSTFKRTQGIWYYVDGRLLS
ncbi:YchJ family protein [Sphingobacterium psychroaquaticum]|uniref:YchJ family protein n=1 Tax=Sphingobacterium psychroaquaticum TaxID=561061 RepID=UPI0021D18DEF|nr:YchJ family metal-binding protein [Sphingobacterium psychroaquaticum]